MYKQLKYTDFKNHRLVVPASFVGKETVVQRWWLDLGYCIVVVTGHLSETEKRWYVQGFLPGYDASKLDDENSEKFEFFWETAANVKHAFYLASSFCDREVATFRKEAFLSEHENAVAFLEGCL